MPSLWSEILGLLMLTAGIIMTHSLVLTSQFLNDSHGYMWRAARRLWGYLLLLFSVEFIIAAFFFYLASMGISFTTFPRYVLAILIGVLAAAAPTALERIALPKEGATVASLQKPLARLLLRFNLALRYNFARAIEIRRQQDVYDCQQPEGWGLGLSPREIGRRIRILYEIMKRDIAINRNDSSLLKYDINRNSWEKFYLLVRHIGRRRLRHYLKNPPVSPCIGWDGSERRRHVGTAAERNISDAVGESSTCRIYDDLKNFPLIKTDAPQLTRS